MITPQDVVAAEELANLSRFDQVVGYSPPRRKILWIENALDCRTWTYYCDIRDAMARLHELCIPVGSSTCIDNHKGFKPDFVVVGPRYTANVGHPDETLGFDRQRYAHLPLAILQNKMYSATTREIVGDPTAKLKWAQETGAIAAFTWLTHHRRFTRLSGVPHFWLPFGIDIELYSRQAGRFGPRAQPFDVGFTGASNVKYPLREAILKLVRSMNVSSYLGTWSQTSLHTSSNRSWKALNRDEYAEQLSRAKMWVSTTGPSNIVGTRYFEVLASGTTLLLCNRAPPGVWVYDGLFEDGTHVVMFDSINDLRSKIMYYLSDEAARRRIVTAAASLSRRIHSWDSRARFISHVLESVAQRSNASMPRHATNFSFASGPNATFLGCFATGSPTRTRDFVEKKKRTALRRFTVAACAATCRSESTTFALECGGFCTGNGHRLGRCWCGSSSLNPSRRRRPRSSCATTCSLHDSRPCGGNGVLAVYSYGPENHSTSAASLGAGAEQVLQGQRGQRANKRRHAGAIKARPRRARARQTTQNHTSAPRAFSRRAALSP